VRITHWLATVAVLALLFSGGEIVISHPRFYWGETGTVMDRSFFDIPIPASRPWVATGYNYVLADQNGWSRNLHFEAAWALVFIGLVYVVWGIRARHFRDNLHPARPARSRSELWNDIVSHLRLKRPDPSEISSYNVVQRLTYLAVIFILAPLAIWTGLALSPALLSVFPFLATAVGGRQSARTIHFFVSLLLFLFLVVHVVMVGRAGFAARVRTMISGRIPLSKEDA
jgi:thiosulfate reductase cytochrome b subunit